MRSLESVFRTTGLTIDTIVNRIFKQQYCVTALCDKGASFRVHCIKAFVELASDVIVISYLSIFTYC